MCYTSITKIEVGSMMEKVKINKGILAFIMITSIFGNWQTMLIIAVLLLLFANIEEDSKKRY